jgi:hypothetical protein
MTLLSPADHLRRQRSISAILRTLSTIIERLFANRNGIPGRNTKLWLASIAKAIYSCILGKDHASWIRFRMAFGMAISYSFKA